jgi:F-type H+-transporting ATPase subunit b
LSARNLGNKRIWIKGPRRPWILRNRPGLGEQGSSVSEGSSPALSEWPILRESFSVSRHMKWCLSLIVMTLCLASFGPGTRLSAREFQGHGAQHSAEEGRIAAAEGVPPEPSINPVKPEPSLAFWTLVVFVTLFFVLTRFAWKPLLAALHGREQHLEHVLLETERARNESEANLAEHRKLMARAGDEVRGILDQARQEAQASADQMIKAAQADAESAKQRAQRDIGQARDQALAEIWEKTADMAVSVAGKVLSKELNDADHRRLLDAAIRELPAGGVANGQGAKRS